jgi:hypothetical protein
MSFLSGLVNFGKNLFFGNSIASNLAKTAALGYLLNRVSNSVNVDNQTQAQDRGSRITVQPNTDYSIPVVYGDAFLEGNVTDARLSSDNRTMWYCLTLCEKTGTLLSTGADSVISFKEAYWDDSKILFKSDGITVDKIVGENGDIIEDYSGLIQFYPFSGNSQVPVYFNGYSTGNTSNAYSFFPGWDNTKDMSDLVFCIVKVTYSSVNNLSQLGKVEFKLSNTLKKPGDVLYDYMTNTRYGAGIPATEIYSS